jgi:hypothetical protein
MRMPHPCAVAQHQCATTDAALDSPAVRAILDVSERVGLSLHTAISQPTGAFGVPGGVRRWTAASLAGSAVYSRCVLQTPGSLRTNLLNPKVPRADLFKRGETGSTGSCVQMARGET